MNPIMHHIARAAAAAHILTGMFLMLVLAII